MIKNNHGKKDNDERDKHKNINYMCEKFQKKCKSAILNLPAGQKKI